MGFWSTVDSWCRDIPIVGGVVDLGKSAVDVGSKVLQGDFSGAAWSTVKAPFSAAWKSGGIATRWVDDGVSSAVDGIKSTAQETMESLTGKGKDGKSGGPLGWLEEKGNGLGEMLGMGEENMLGTITKWGVPIAGALLIGTMLFGGGLGGLGGMLGGMGMGEMLMIGLGAVAAIAGGAAIFAPESGIGKSVRGMFGIDTPEKTQEVSGPEQQKTQAVEAPAVQNAKTTEVAGPPKPAQLASEVPVLEASDLGKTTVVAAPVAVAPQPKEVVSMAASQ